MGKYYFDHVRDEEEPISNSPNNHQNENFHTQNKQSVVVPQKNNNYKNNNYTIGEKKDKNKKKKGKKARRIKILCACIIICIIGAIVLGRNNDLENTEYKNSDDSSIIEIEDNGGQNANRIETLKEPSEMLQEKLSTEYLENSDILDLSNKDIQLLINIIYAKHGRVFEFPENISYFENQDWYVPIKGKTDEQIVSELNSFERANVDLLSSQLGSE